MTVALYAIVERQAVGRTSAQTLALFAISIGLLTGFAGIETHVRSPIVPIWILRRNNLAICAVIQLTASAALYAWGFMGTLYLQQVLKYSQIAVALAFLPTNLIAASFSLGLSSRLVNRFGNRSPLTVGLLLMATGVALFVLAHVHGRYAVEILPGMVLVGMGLGVAPTPLNLAAMSDVPPNEAGLASGIVNTASVMGGSLGLAILVSVAASRTYYLRAQADEADALNGGYHLAFLLGAVLMGATAGFCAVWLRTNGKQ